MTVEFQIERQDFLDLLKGQRRFRSDSLSRLYYYGILPVLGVGLAIMVQSFAIAAVFTALFVGSGWFIQARIQSSYDRNVYSEENLFFSIRRWSATLADDGLRVSSDAADVLYRWPLIKRVFREKRCVIFEITPIKQFFIPIRAFKNEEHILAFMDKAQSYIKRPAV